MVKVFVCPAEDAEFARRATRPFPAWILNREPCRRFHEWLGPGEMLRASHESWDAGDVQGAQDALPPEAVDGLYISGPPEECRDKILRYHRPGVTTIQLYVALPTEVLNSPDRLLDTLARLAPGA